MVTEDQSAPLVMRMMENAGGLGFESGPRSQIQEGPFVEGSVACPEPITEDHCKSVVRREYLTWMINMYRKPFLFALFACSITAVPAAAESLQQRIDGAIQSEIERSGAPSIQVAIGYEEKVIFEGAFGFADVENSVLATPATKYRSASISKWLTSTAAMRLAEQGRLELDESIHQYCPQFPKKRWPITTRQLLTHTAGVRHYADYESELSNAQTAEERAEIETRQTRDQLSTYTRYTDVDATLDTFKDDPLVFEPGTSWLYSSFGYRLLACVLEGASGRTYRDLLEGEIMNSAGMESTMPDDAWAIIPHRAAGYRLDRGAALRRADLRDVSENLPAGGHLTMATDLMAFSHAFHAGQLVSTQSASVMIRGLSVETDENQNFTSWRHVIPSRDKYAYGIMSFPNENDLWIGHTGRQA
ncbi:MAG: serine hydrolase domain-containing protein, partial [Gammaproteobacteria bacterium]